jgi:hypothetical protein
MWTIKNRKRYDRSHLRYPSDLSDAKGFVVLPKRWIVERTIAGSIAAGALPKILRISTAMHWLSFDLPPSGSCCESSVILDKLLGQTLSNVIAV